MIDMRKIWKYALSAYLWARKFCFCAWLKILKHKQIRNKIIILQTQPKAILSFVILSLLSTSGERLD